MKILIVGAGKGSWVMRGQQLGAALGARVTSSPTDQDLDWCDLVVLVKKHAVTHATRCHKHGKPIVWDALDFWSQPAQNSYNEAAAVNALLAQLRFIKPTLTIGATQAMTRAIEQQGFTSAYLPHHSWQGLMPSPSREHVATVGYEGNAAYLGRWHGWLTEACQKRGWSFVVNPSTLAEVDIVVALRDGLWDGWMCREWKSGVKVVNAMAADRPLISQDCAAVRELNPDGSVITCKYGLNEALDVWAPNDKRCATLPRPLPVDAVAGQYQTILSKVVTPCTA